MNRICEIRLTGTAGDSLTKLAYTLNASGHRTAISKATGRSSTYSHDALYRLIGETTTVAETGNRTKTSSFDAVDTRVSTRFD